MAAVTNDVIDEVVQDYLRGFEDLSAVKTKDVRLYVLKKLNLPDDYFSGDRKEDLVMMITSFKRPTKKKKVVTDQDVELSEGKYKEGRFSKEESDTVMEAGLRYVEERGISLAELCSSNKVKGAKDSKHKEFWREVAILLPSRKKDAIWHHAQRIFSRQECKDGRFSKEDQVTLLALLKQHGRDFTQIGRLMGRLPDDCQQMALRLQGRANSGPFTDEEDAQLVAAMLRALKLSAGTSIVDLPTQRLPWVSVTKLLADKRLAVDYRRRWPVLVKKAKLEAISSALQNGEQLPVDADPEVVKLSIPAPHGRLSIDPASINARRLQLLDKLIEEGYADESEVNWAAIDRELNYGNNTSLHRWRSMLKTCPSNKSSFEDRLSFLHEQCTEEAQRLGVAVAGSSGSSASSDASLQAKSTVKAASSRGTPTKAVATSKAKAGSASSTKKRARSGSASSTSESGSVASWDEDQPSVEEVSESSSQSEESADSSTVVRADSKKGKAAVPSPAAVKPKGKFAGPVLNPPRAKAGAAAAKKGAAGKTDASASGSDSSSDDSGHKKKTRKKPDEAEWPDMLVPSPVAAPAGKSKAAVRGKEKKPVLSDSSSSSSSDSESESEAGAGSKSSHSSKGKGSRATTGDHKGQTTAKARSASSSSSDSESESGSDAEADLEEIFAPTPTKKPFTAASGKEGKGAVKAEKGPGAGAGAGKVQSVAVKQDSEVDSDLSSEEGPNVHEVSSSSESDSSSDSDSDGPAEVKHKPSTNGVKAEKEAKWKAEGKKATSAGTLKKGAAPLSIEQMYGAEESSLSSSSSSARSAQGPPPKSASAKTAGSPAMFTVNAETQRLPLPTHSQTESATGVTGAGAASGKKKKKTKRKNNRRRAGSSDSSSDSDHDGSRDPTSGAGKGKGNGQGGADSQVESNRKRKHRGKRHKSTGGEGATHSVQSPPAPQQRKGAGLGAEGTQQGAKRKQAGAESGAAGKKQRLSQR